jgi:hypothetical protein
MTSRVTAAAAAKERSEADISRPTIRTADRGTKTEPSRARKFS